LDLGGKKKFAKRKPAPDLDDDYAPPEVSEGNLKAAVASPQKRTRRTRDKPTPKPGFIYY